MRSPDPYLGPRRVRARVPHARARVRLCLCTCMPYVQSFWREQDNAGVQDSVLLEDYENESVFLDNLEKRFKKDLIYVSRRGHALLDDRLQRNSVPGPPRFRTSDANSASCSAVPCPALPCSA